MKLRNKPDVDSDELYMFRCLIAIAHSDNAFEKPEREFIQNIIDGNLLNNDQRQILESDISAPQQIEDLFPHIKNPIHRSQVVHFARVMAYRDGELEAQENTILNKLHANAMKHVDKDAIQVEVKNALNKEQGFFEESMQKHKIPSWIEKLQDFLSNIGLGF